MATAAPGSLPPLGQSQGAVGVGDGNNSTGGMEELLPLVLQLTNPDQVRDIVVVAVVVPPPVWRRCNFLLDSIYCVVVFISFYREKQFYWNYPKRGKRLLI